jgi:hypothetical protein
LGGGGQKVGPAGDRDVQFVVPIHNGHGRVSAGMCSKLRRSPDAVIHFEEKRQYVRQTDRFVGDDDWPASAPCADKLLDARQFPLKISNRNQTGNSMAECYLCGRLVDEREARTDKPGSPADFPCCGAYAHENCLKNQGFVDHESGGVLSSATLHVECPSCGKQHTDDPGAWR